MSTGGEDVRSTLSLQEMDVLQYLLSHSVRHQRELADRLGMALGAVNRSLHSLEEAGMITADYRLTAAAKALGKRCTPRRAVILAAGHGLQAGPLRREIPKGLIEIQGRPIIEHTILQLQEAGVREICIVTGFMKEQYEYLTDKYPVTTRIARDYMNRNNLYSLACAADLLENAYIVPCDVYFPVSPFRGTELYSWYMLSRETAEEGEIRSKRNREIVNVGSGEPGNRIIGLCYLTEEDAGPAREKLLSMTAGGKNRAAFWEAIITEKNRMLVPARLVGPEEAMEINTCEQLLEVDYYRRLLNHDAMDLIRKVFKVSREEIRNITVLKKGLSNHSVLFSVRGKRYILRIPGEGTADFVDRRNEKKVYELLRGKGFCEENIWLDGESGYKISRYIENARGCRDEDPEEVAGCMRLLRRLHGLQLHAPAGLDLFGVLEKYEGFRKGEPSQFRDYPQVREAVEGLRPYLESHALPAVLTHGDCNPDNFLFSAPGGKQRIDLIDWEYAADCDPLVDLAAFILYHAHPKPKEFADRVIDAYYPEGCPREIRLQVYGYCAAWALYTSNWCEYKMQLGVDLGDFALIQYRYARTFCRIFREEYGAAGE